MQNKLTFPMNRLSAAALASASLWLAGCGIAPTSTTTAPITVPGVKVQGKVYGGQQPVTGSTVQLYAASNAGYGAASYALLTTAVVTDVTGSFGITGDYTCPSANTPVYITATGGNSGAGAVNPQIAMMTALGACGNLSSSTFVSINELTTVAAVWALAPFMNGYNAIGSSSTNTAGLNNAFATANKLVSTATGIAPGTVPTGTTVPVAELNTLANILAACINTAGGTAGDGTACGQLFTATAPFTGPAPTDTIGAALSIATNPSHNVSSLLRLPAPQSPFQPTISSATDLTVSLKYTPAGLSAPNAAAVDANGSLYIANASANRVVQLDTTGAVAGTYTVTSPSALAIDSSNNAWVTSRTTNSLYNISGGTAVQRTVTGLNAPSAISIDSRFLLWVTNSGNSTVTSVNVFGTNVTGSSTYSGAGITNPVAVAVDPK